MRLHDHFEQKKPFQEIWTRNKTFIHVPETEFKCKFQTDDTILIKERNHGEVTGRYILAKITYLEHYARMESFASHTILSIELVAWGNENECEQK